MQALVRHIARDTLIYFLLCAGTYLMLRIILPHLQLERDTGFLATKQAYVHNPVWRTSFYIHVFSSMLSLVAGFTQFSSFLLKEYRPLHRIMGRIYVFAIVFINFPSGMILALNANGLFLSRIAFVLLDCLWFFFTLRAYWAIRQGNVQWHRDFMIRSYALTLSALTLRSWKLVLSTLFVIDTQTLYRIDAWMGFVPNLLLAEWLIRRRKSIK